MEIQGVWWYLRGGVRPPQPSRMVRLLLFVALGLLLIPVSFFTLVVASPVIVGSIAKIDNRRITAPELVPIQQEGVGKAALNPSGSLLAVEFASEHSGRRLRVFQASGGRSLGSFPLPDRPALDLIGWAGNEELWAARSAYRPYNSSCSGAVVARAPEWKFYKTCNQVPTAVSARPQNAVPPKGADVSTHCSNFAEEGKVVHRGDVYAIQVCDRFGGREYDPIYDIRLLDGRGQFIKQFADLSLVGLAAHGDLIVKRGDGLYRIRSRDFLPPVPG